jgi:hypothetical protein
VTRAVNSQANGQVGQQVAIVHFSPIEQYPPVQNLIRISAAAKGAHVSVHTTRDNYGRCWNYGGSSQVHRYSNPAGKRPWKRVLAYLHFHFGTFFRLMMGRAESIIYIEPSSSLPVFLYTLINKDCRIFIHHHEYHSPDQFLRPGMRLIRCFHWLERRYLFRRAVWLSHTNAKRMELFVRDCPMIPKSVCRILPNHPPSAWAASENLAWLHGTSPFRFVYVGSLSLRDTHIEAFVRWLETQIPGSVELDVYAYNLDEPCRQFLKGARPGLVNFHPQGVDYDSLPGILATYHAGVILYRAETLNYRYNETNKLFEYLACGLDVWFSHTMEGIKPHACLDAAPRVIECDFEGMGERHWKQFMETGNGRQRRRNWSAEESSAPLFQELGLKTSDS